MFLDLADEVDVRDPSPASPRSRSRARRAGRPWPPSRARIPDTAGDLDRRERSLLIRDPADEGPGSRRGRAARRGYAVRSSPLYTVAAQVRSRSATARRWSSLMETEAADPYLGNRSRRKSRSSRPCMVRTVGTCAQAGERKGPDVEVGVHDVEVVCPARRSRPPSAGAGGVRGSTSSSPAEALRAAVPRTTPAPPPSPTSSAPRKGDLVPLRDQTVAQGWRSLARCRRTHPAGRPRRAERPARSSRAVSGSSDCPPPPGGLRRRSLTHREQVTHAGRRRLLAGPTLQAAVGLDQHLLAAVRARHLEHGAHLRDPLPSGNTVGWKAP